MEGSKIFLDALFDGNLKNQNSGLQRNGRVGEDGLHSGRVKEGLRRCQLDNEKSDNKTASSRTINSLTRSSNHALARLM